MATSSLEEKWEHPDRSAQDEEDQDQDQEEEEEESLSLCDLPVNMVEGESNQPIRDEEAHKETETNQEDFDFGPFRGGDGSLSNKSDMCAADDVFFQGQILPLRLSVSSESGVNKFKNDTSLNPCHCLSRSESMDRNSLGGLTSFSSRSSSSRSHYSSSSSSTSSAIGSTRMIKPIIQNQFLTHPSPKPQIRLSSASLGNAASSKPRNSSVWDFFRLGLVRTPEIEFQDLKVRNYVSTDVLAGFEAAIHDGVDILSVSLGSGPREYFTHGNAIGAFLAMERGILVVASAGNKGPDPGIVGNVAPWILTVACSTISREFTSNVFLGNNKQYKGVSFNTNTQPARKFYPLINSVDAKAANVSSNQAKYCSIGSLDPLKVKGKIVYCTRNEDRDVVKSLVVAQAGGVGVILASQLIIQQIRPRAHFVPTSAVSADDGLSILTYVYSTKSPVAYISGATEVGTVAAPVMADFSSPGPNFITPEILKPDITAPGVNILAAFTGASGPTDVPGDRRRVHFNFISGTSMACPHVSGIAGLLKTMHPDWSPAAIKSAIMTTATTISNVKQPIANASLLEANPLNYGAGHIWPSRAMDPGLVYDLTTKDYVNFLCSIGYNSTQLSLFIGKPYICPSRNNGLLDFNYPSITVPNLSSNKTTVSRTLKNVGTPSLYRVNIRAPGGISVKVEPRSLKFDKINEEKMFKVTLEAKKGFKSNDYVFGEITWSDGKHHVRSPVVVKKMEAAA